MIVREITVYFFHHSLEHQAVQWLLFHEFRLGDFRLEKVLYFHCTSTKKMEDGMFSLIVLAEEQLLLLVVFVAEISLLFFISSAAMECWSKTRWKCQSIFLFHRSGGQSCSSDSLIFLFLFLVPRFSPTTPVQF